MKNIDIEKNVDIVDINKNAKNVNYSNTIIITEEDISNANNELIKAAAKLDQLIITKTEQLQIKDLINRIDKADKMLEKIQKEIKEYLNLGIGVKEISDIQNVLRGDSNE